HHIPGTPDEGWEGNRMRCGGISLCAVCSVHGHRHQPYSTKLKTGLNVDFNTFVRKPFTVEAVEITDDNIEAISEFVGTLKQKEDGSPYLLVDRRLVPNVYRVYPGFWMTKMGDNIRCYSKRVFTDQFIQSPEPIMNWVDFINGSPSEEASVLED